MVVIGDSVVAPKPLAMVVWGTRPEHVKLFPVIRDLRSRETLRVRTVFTGQHADLVDHANLPVEIDEELCVMRAGRPLQPLLAKLLASVGSVEMPAMVVVQGDTSSALAGALAGFYGGVPVAHVEAGLTSHNWAKPFPEEMHRRLIRELSNIHFAHTYWAADNLKEAGVEEENIWVTGNTVVDSLEYLAAEHGLEIPSQEKSGEVLVTIHRRENEEWLPDICEELCKLQVELGQRVVFIAHPRVADVVRKHLEGKVEVTPPMDYLSFVKRMSRADFVVTDSGGLQEEGVTLGVPVFVVRDSTERQEAVHAGRSFLVGQSAAGLATQAKLMERRLDEMGAGDRGYIYGDGHASERIGDVIEKWLEPTWGWQDG